MRNGGRGHTRDKLTKAPSPLSSKSSVQKGGAYFWEPRTLVPLDGETLIASVVKTTRAVIIDEGHKRFGITGELASLVYRGAFDYIDAPIARLGAMDVPVPFSKPLEDATIPTAADVVNAVREMGMG